MKPTILAALRDEHLHLSLDKSSREFFHGFAGKSHYDNAPVICPSVDTTSEFFTDFSCFTCETSDKCGKAGHTISKRRPSDM